MTKKSQSARSARARFDEELGVEPPRDRAHVSGDRTSEKRETGSSVRGRRWDRPEPGSVRLRRRWGRRARPCGPRGSPRAAGGRRRERRRPSEGAFVISPKKARRNGKDVGMIDDVVDETCARQMLLVGNVVGECPYDAAGLTRERFALARQKKEVVLDFAEARPAAFAVLGDLEDDRKSSARDRARQMVRALHERDVPADGGRELEERTAFWRDARSVSIGSGFGRRDARLRRPLLLESPPVVSIDPEVFLFRKRAEASPSPMVDEGIARDRHAVVLLAEAVRVVVVLEHSDDESFVEGPDLFVHAPANEETEHREHVDRVGAPDVAAREDVRPGVQVGRVPISDLDLRFVVDLVGRGSDGSERSIPVKVPHERRQPAARDERVVVQETQIFAVRGGDAQVDGRSESTVFRESDEPKIGPALPGLRGDPLGGSVFGSVVDEDHLASRPVGMAIDRLEAHAVELDAVVRDDDDRDLRVELSNPGLECDRALVPRVLPAKARRRAAVAGASTAAASTSRANSRGVVARRTMPWFASEKRERIGVATTGRPAADAS